MTKTKDELIDELIEVLEQAKVLLDGANDYRTEIAQLKKSNVEYRATFEMQMKADRRAISIWQTKTGRIAATWW